MTAWQMCPSRPAFRLRLGTSSGAREMSGWMVPAESTPMESRRRQVKAVLEFAARSLDAPVPGR